jgi:hypothetical protein
MHIEIPTLVYCRWENKKNVVRKFFFLRVLRAPFYSISVSGAFLGTSLPPTPIGVGSIYIWMFTVLYFIVFLTTHYILFIILLHVLR